MDKGKIYMYEGETTVFALCKEAVILLRDLIWKVHIHDKHKAGTVNECDRSHCAEVKTFFAKLDEELFHGTMADEMDDVIDMEDLTGVKS